MKDDRLSLFSSLPDLIKDLIYHYVHLTRMNRLNAEYQSKIKVHDRDDGPYKSLFYNIFIIFKDIPMKYYNMRHLNKYFPRHTTFNTHSQDYQLQFSDLCLNVSTVGLPKNYFYTGISRHSELLYFTRNLDPIVKEQIQRYLDDIDF